jgi:hypothetical protein
MNSEKVEKNESSCSKYTTKLCDSCKLSLKSIPILNQCMGISLLIINIIFPGFGTMFLLCCAEKNNTTHLFIGFCQFISSFLLIGWILSIVWGLEIFRQSRKFKSQEEINNCPNSKV